MNYARIVILLPCDRVRSWVLTLADDLRARLALPVEFHRLDDSETPLPSLPFEDLERRLFGSPSLAHANWISTKIISGDVVTGWASSLIISAAERDPRDLPPYLRTRPVLAPLFEGGYALGGLFSALLAGKPPVLEVALVVDMQTRLINAAQVAIPDRELTSRAVATVLARSILLLRGACEHLARGNPLPLPGRVTLDKKPLPVYAPRLHRVLRTYLPKVVHQLPKPFVQSESWCIAYRHDGLGGNPPDIDFRNPEFSLINPDHDRYYADPMLCEYRGKTVVFFEDFEYRNNRGRISFVTLSDDGTCGEPIEALSRAYHLSYPFVFCDADTVLMVPETSSNRTVELYEATRFPDKWRLRSILLEDINAADATFHLDAGSGIWWMFASVCEYDNAAWDTLSIFFSHCIDGPWQPHALNPVKFDPRSSRPAGPLISQDGRLFRPAQDCSHHYGGGLVWCEIKELTPRTFHEDVVGSLSPTKRYNGLHTYCRAGGFEVVDLRRARWKGGSTLRRTITALRGTTGRSEEPAGSGEGV